MFSAFAVFLRLLFALSFTSSELYRHAIVVTEDTISDDNPGRIRKSSFSSMLRKGSTCNIADDSLIVECPVERQIRYFVDFCPSLDPSLQLNVAVDARVHE